MKVNYGVGNLTFSQFPPSIHELRESLEDSLAHKAFENLDQNQREMIESLNLNWGDFRCYFYDSDGDRNDLSDDEDLAVAQLYSRKKKVELLECGLEEKKGQNLEQVIFNIQQDFKK